VPGAHGSHPKFPLEVVLMYSACYSLPILLVYAPAYSALVRTGRGLVEHCLSANDPAATAWVKSARERAELEKVFQIDTGVLDRIKSGIIILSPVLAGAISLLISGK
jgi:hypothetical protein